MGFKLKLTGTVPLAKGIYAAALHAKQQVVIPSGGLGVGVSKSVVKEFSQAIKIITAPYP